MVSIRNY